MASNTLRLLLIASLAGSSADRACFVLDGNAADSVTAIAPAPGVDFPPPARRRADRPFRLHLLHLNDLHGHISRLEQPGSPPILSNVAGRMRQLRGHCQDDSLSAVLLLSAGDGLAGSIFDDVSANGVLHPVYHLYSRMGLDVAVLGNHDLDLGPARLAEAIRRHARFPVLAANLAPAPELADLVHPAALLVVKGVRVGLVGLTTPARAGTRPGLAILDPARTLANLLPALRPLCDVPLLHAGSLGRYLGEATITVNGAAAVTDARLSPVHELPADPQFELEAVQPIIAHAQRLMQRPLGRVERHPDLRTQFVPVGANSAER